MDTSVPKKNSEEVASLTKTETVPLADVTVWIDPLDATKEYSGMFYKTLSSLIKQDDAHSMHYAGYLTTDH